MPIEGMYWDSSVRAMEVHVLQGKTSPDLRDGRLQFTTRDATNDPIVVDAKKYMADHPGDVTLKFTIADASKTAGSSSRTLPGVTLDTATGAVTVASALPALFAQNFLLEVTATSGGLQFREMIRVHLHRSIESIWLTPGTLKVRPKRNRPFPQETAFRFGLRARFGDQTVGDITDWDEVVWSSKRGSASTDNIDVDSGTFKLQSGDAAAAAITVSARLNGFAALGSVSATLRVLEPWKPEAPVEVRLVPGAGKPETKKTPEELIPFSPDAVPNVLFLPDGFPQAEKENFFKYVNSTVTFIKNTSLCKPYDVLAQSINFWAAFLASDQQGSTWGSEVFATGTAPDLFVKAVPVPVRPLDPPTRSPWAIEELIYEVGLATPADRPENSARTDAAIRADWESLFGVHHKARLPTDADELAALIREWRELGRRRLLDDVDTPLGMLSGAPRVDFADDLVDLNPDRMDRELIDDLMASLRHDKVASSGLILDKLWTDARKRNYDLVCIVTLGQGRQLNGTGYFTLSQEPKEQACTLSGVNDIVPATVPTKSKAPPTEALVFAHELSHSFDLGDEYGGFNDRPLFPIEAEHSHRVFGNIQSDSTVRVAAQVTGEEVKWRWPRIRWAAELIGALVDEGGGKFAAPIRLSHAFGVPVGEVVHLRFRNIDYAFRDIDHDGVHYDDDSAYLGKLPLVSVPLKLLEVFEEGTPRAKKVRFQVHPTATFPYPAARKVPKDQFIAKFPAGSIVYQPTRAPDGVYDATTYPYAELIAKNVMEYVTFLHSPTGKINADLSLPEVPSLMAMPVPSWFPNAALPLIVGLHEGGMGNMKGVYHPTGNCKMSRPDQGARFCQVCRYIIVDAIDPSRHFFIDPEYTEIYPQR